MLNPPELLVIGGIALLLFGPKKLPEFSRSLGRSLAEFKKGVNDVTRDVHESARAEMNRTEVKDEPKAAE